MPNLKITQAFSVWVNDKDDFRCSRQCNYFQHVAKNLPARCTFFDQKLEHAHGHGHYRTTLCLTRFQLDEESEPKVLTPKMGKRTVSTP